MKRDHSSDPKGSQGQPGPHPGWLEGQGKDLEDSTKSWSAAAFMIGRTLCIAEKESWNLVWLGFWFSIGETLE